MDDDPSSLLISIKFRALCTQYLYRDQRYYKIPNEAEKLLQQFYNTAISLSMKRIAHATRYFAIPMVFLTLYQLWRNTQCDSTCQQINLHQNSMMY